MRSWLPLRRTLRGGIPHDRSASHPALVILAPRWCSSAPRRRKLAPCAGAVRAAFWTRQWRGAMPETWRGGGCRREGDIEIDFCAIISKYSGAG
jgi:hypothetical protein